MLSMVPRFTIAMVTALVVTFLVALLMQGLISSGGSVIEDNGLGKLESFVHVKQDDDVQTKSREVKKPPTPPVEPPKPEMAKPKFDDVANDAIDMGSMSMDANLSVEGGLAGATGDGEYLPIIRIAPQYPRRAQQKGIEGFVDLEFTVTKLGTTKDVFVINAEPANIFDQAAINSVKKYKYKPTVEDGKAIDVPGVQIRVSFAMETKDKKGK